MDINRKTAFKTLMDIETKGAYSNLSLNDNIRRFRPDDPAFTREIVYGTLKNKYLLDHFLQKYISRGYNRLKADILTIMRMGAYQLIFMGSVPGYAAVSETVDIAKKFVRGREAFVNGVLRNMSREVRTLEWPKREDYGTAAEFFEVRYSVNRWIAEELISCMGEDGVEEFLKFSNETPELSIRANLLINSTDELENELSAEGFTVRRSLISKRCLLVSGSGLLDTEAYRSGRFSVQDEASCLAADTLDPEPGMTVIDVCAAPGGKTAALGELMGNEGELRAFDVHEHKIPLIEGAARRSGLTIVRCEAADASVRRKESEGKADRVLCDVPCSGLGVIRRKPEIKYRDAFSIKELSDLQYKILEASSGYLKPGGALVYSTCTVTDEENHQVTEKFLENNKGFRRESERQMGPADKTDGFYITKIVREA